MGGTQVGVIYPNEFYTLVPNDSHYITNYLIIFRDGAGSQRTGYVESSPGYTLGYYGWVQYQEPYHYYNSNGSSLTASATESISGKAYRILQLKSGNLSESRWYISRNLISGN